MRHPLPAVSGLCVLAAQANAQSASIRYYFYVPVHMSAFEWHQETTLPPMDRTYSFAAQQNTGGSGGIATAQGTTTTNIDIGTVRAQSQVSIFRPQGGIGAPRPFISSDWEPHVPQFANFSCTDVVFTDTANPGSSAAIQVWVSAQYRGFSDFGGSLPCSFNLRQADLGFSLGLQGQTTGGRYVRRDLDSSSSFPPGVLPDGQTYVVTAGPYVVTLGTSVSLHMAAAAEVSAGICFPPASEMSPVVDAVSKIFLQPGQMVFTLPPGITANSSQARIVNNVFLGAPPACDSIDFNNDGSSFDPQDIDAFLSVYGEGPCIPETATCNDIDFNNDGSLFDPCDISAFLLVFSEGPCTLCGL